MRALENAARRMLAPVVLLGGVAIAATGCVYAGPYPGPGPYAVAPAPVVVAPAVVAPAPVVVAPTPVISFGWGWGWHHWH